MEISVFKFLERYYGITLDMACRWSHNQIQEKFIFLKSCSYEYVCCHQELVSTGKIIGVYDSNNIIKYYIPPKEIIKLNVIIDKFGNPPNDMNILNELDNIPTYKVRELLSIYKDSKSFYRLIKKELIKRGIYNNKRYKLDKEINILEESEYNDKYQRRRKIKCKKS